MLKRWWKAWFTNSQERRKGDRVSSPNLSAYYWNGSNAEKHEVRDISPSGLYVVTDDRWYPGTIVRMTVQKDGEDGSDAEVHIAVDSRAVRYGKDGVGMSFVTGDKERGSEIRSVKDEVRDRKGMEQFLSRLLRKRG